MEIISWIGYDAGGGKTMTGLEDKIWKILKEPQTAALATISESGAPWVRYVTIRAASDFTLNFCTGLSTRKAGEIAADPNVHLTCGNLQPPDGSAYLQIAGRAEIRNDKDTRTHYWQDGWQQYFQGPEDPEYIIILVQPARIEYNAPGSPTPMVWTK
jgi:general stress protein 26